MLTLNPGLMYSMDTGHLIRSLEFEPSIMRTPVELELMRRCYGLMDERDERIEVDDIEAHVTEAMAQYPENCFLEKLANRVFELSEKLRGDNKVEARAIFHDLTELELRVETAADHGRQELTEILHPKRSDQSDLQKRN